MKANRLILFISMLFSALSSFAEDINALMLHLASGKQVVCMLDEKPVVSFCGDELILTTHMNEVRYQSEDVLKFTYFHDGPTNVGKAEISQSRFLFSENTLSVIGAEPDSQITVYSLDGILIVSAKTDKNGSATVSLPEQSGKVYVVKTSIANFKITKP